MGALSALVVTACVAPPLVAALAVIGQTGEVVRGGARAVRHGASAWARRCCSSARRPGSFLPHAGPWMDTVKALFGVLFLGVAVWMLVAHPARAA